ncbi:MAG: ATP-binding protein [Candidatus Woesearchaeota archaeon]
MNPNFINRELELKFLNKVYSSKEKQLIIIYGRRRIGKTELISYFSKNKDHIYFLADKRGTKDNVKRFIEKVCSYFNDFPINVDNFDKVFEYIIKRTNKKLIITIDEFSYLVEKDDSIPSIFQLIVDQILNNNIVLILCGSSISMMEEGTLSYKSPLYGRRTGQWKVDRFNIKDAIKFFPNQNIEQKIISLAILGEIPAYLVKFDNNKNIFNNIKEKILTKGEYLYSEGKNLFLEEFREPETYYNIVEAMTKSTKLTEIANSANIPAKDMPKYLKKLIKIDLIEKINPITENNTKKSSYLIKDSFIKFWFKYVYSNISSLEENKVDEVLNIIKKDLNLFVSFYFEYFCMQLLKNINILDFNKIGKQWGKFDGTKGKNTYEIDIVALNDKEILFCECKYKDNVDAERIYNELKEKSKLVKWNNEKRIEHYAIFAKSFKRKFKEKNLYIYDLKDIEKMLK